jgi:type VI secretion system protein ImpE
VSARELFKAGKLEEAIEALNGEVRGNPTDVQRRAFLFELLGFAGNHERAEKQLDILSQENQQAAMGALLYRSALHADRTRCEMFERGDYPQGPAPPTVAGTMNGEPFESLVDGDPRIGARFEVFAAGEYMWIPMEHVASVQMEAPTQLRDLLWAPALVQTGPTFRKLELGKVLLPVMTPLACRHPDEHVRIGRVTEWTETDGVETPAGQKLFLVDGEEFPILELRNLEINTTSDDS